MGGKCTWNLYFRYLWWVDPLSAAKATVIQVFGSGTLILWSTAKTSSMNVNCNVLLTISVTKTWDQFMSNCHWAQNQYIFAGNRTGFIFPLDFGINSWYLYCLHLFTLWSLSRRHCAPMYRMEYCQTDNTVYVTTSGNTLNIKWNRLTWIILWVPSNVYAAKPLK